MKILILLLSFCTTALVFWFCKTPKYTADTLPQKQLRWGKGGGFVGKETLHLLLENGQIFKQEDTAGKPVEMDDTRRAKAKKLFKLLETTGIQNLDFQHPGNTYKFLDIVEGESTKRISWGDAQYPVDAAVEDLYKQLEALVATETGK